MLHVCRYTLVVRESSSYFKKVELPLEAWLAKESLAKLTRDEDEYCLSVSTRVPLDRIQLKRLDTRRHRVEDSGLTVAVPAIRIKPNRDGPKPGVQQFVDALAFLTDAVLSLRRSEPPRIVPEDTDDALLIRAFDGVTDVYDPGYAIGTTRTMNPMVEGGTITALLPRQAGLRLYSDALHAGNDVAKFRAYWRVLEAAFGCQSTALVNCLASYPPAIEVGFTQDELHELKQLRGSISHAQEQEGLAAILRASQQAEARLPRLKTLVERVVLTKRDWASRNLRVLDLMPPSCWVTTEGGVHYVKNPRDPDPIEIVLE